MKFSFTCCLLVILAIPGSLYAQYNEQIRSGRPGQAIGPFTVGLKVSQIQAGYNYNSFASKDLERSGHSEYLVVRHGFLTENLELSTVLAWTQIDDQINNTDIKSNGLSDFRLGARYHVTDQEGWKPAIGIQGRALIKIDNDLMSSEMTGVKCVLITGNKLTDRFSFISNWAISSKRTKDNLVGSYVLNLSYSIDDQFGTFVELYGGFDPYRPFVDTGISYLVNNDLQLDFSIGYQGYSDVDDWYADAGISWRVKRSKN